MGWIESLSRDEPTSGRARVDVEPRPLIDQVPADVDEALGRGDVQHVLPNVVPDVLQVHLLRRLWPELGEKEEEAIKIRPRTTMRASCDGKEKGENNGLVDGGAARRLLLRRRRLPLAAAWRATRERAAASMAVTYGGRLAEGNEGP
jgi:hypothetical protein